MFATVVMIYTIYTLYLGIPKFFISISSTFIIVCGFGTFAAIRYDLQLEQWVLCVCLLFGVIYSLLNIALLFVMFKIWFRYVILFVITVIIIMMCFIHRLAYIKWLQLEVQQMMMKEVGQ